VSTHASQDTSGDRYDRPPAREYASRVHDAKLQLAIFGRMALAAALGFMVGYEREARGKAAGERTIALVAAGAAAFASLAAEAFPETGGQLLAGVATGVGFLGIGVIWRLEMGPARGLTTAAATWTVAATGVLAGVGLYLTAVLATAITMLILELEFMPVIGPRLHRTNPGSNPEGGPPGPGHG
jgi:putative Mg2+ transporter-C (MgtC) family protein